MILRVLPAVGCALVLALSGCSGSPSAPAAAATLRTRPNYSLMQMNLCLSGLAGCYGKTAYPAVLDEAAARISEVRPNAVTVNEACRGDAARIARATGYHLRFSRVIYLAAPLPCIRPVGRGLFGDAVLTKAAVVRTEERDFATQAGVERRRWLCVTTRGSVDVCTSHLDTRTPLEVAGNEPQCLELTEILARRAARGPVIFGGDMNRTASCAPGGLWTRTDSSARQDPGIQQVYGSGAFRSPSAQVLPAVHTDHDFLVVRARLDL